jgi:hypothetical protein
MQYNQMLLSEIHLVYTYSQFIWRQIIYCFTILFVLKVCNCKQCLPPKSFQNFSIMYHNQDDFHKSSIFPFQNTIMMLCYGIENYLEMPFTWQNLLMSIDNVYSPPLSFFNLFEFFSHFIFNHINFVFLESGKNLWLVP